MKKVIKIIIGIITIMVITGCKKNTIEGESLLIELQSNPSTGYVWTYTITNNDIISLEGDYDDSNCEKNVVGCGGYNVYNIKALKQGEATIEFIYSKGTKKEDDKTAIYTITVDKNLKIAETHKGSYFLIED